MSGPTPALGSDELAKLAARCAPQLRINLSHADHRLVLTHFGDLVEGIEAHELVAPLTERTRNRYLNLVENLRRWCVMEGFVEEGAQLHEVPVASLRTLVELWLAWRCSEVTEDHPLVEVGRATRAGMRRGTQGLQDPAELRATLCVVGLVLRTLQRRVPHAQAISGARGRRKGPRTERRRDRVRHARAVPRRGVRPGLFETSAATCATHASWLRSTCRCRPR